MGATTFVVTAKGKTAAEAFAAACQLARVEARAYAEDDEEDYDFDGTIASKSRFVLLTLPRGKSARDYAEQLLETDGGGPITDKWGPAGCLPAGKGEWVFFGWAPT